MFHIPDLQMSIWILLASGVIASVLLCFTLIKYIKQLKKVAIVAISIVSLMSIGLSGVEFSTYAAYEHILGYGFFYADMFLNGVDATKSLTIDDVISLKPSMVVNYLLTWMFCILLATVFVTIVVSLCVYGIIFIFSKRCDEESVFVVLFPIIMVIVSAVTLSFKSASFSVDIVSPDYHYLELDIALPKDELHALDVLCPSNSAIYLRHELACDGEVIEKRLKIWAERLDYPVVVVWSDDLERQKVILKAFELPVNRAKVGLTTDVSELISELNRRLMREAKWAEEKKKNEAHWVEAEIVIERSDLKDN